MAEVLVFDTGPLIAFERMGCLEQIGRLPFDFICPEEVRRELDEGEEIGHPRISSPWLSVHALSSAPAPFGVAGLGLGEALIGVLSGLRAGLA